MILQRTGIKYFFADTVTKVSYCVTFITGSRAGDSTSVLIQSQAPGKTSWKNIEATETNDNPQIWLAQSLLKKATKCVIAS